MAEGTESSTIRLHFARVPGFDYSVELLPEWNPNLRFIVPIVDTKEPNIHQCVIEYPKAANKHEYTLIISKSLRCACSHICQHLIVVGRFVVRTSVHSSLLHYVIFYILPTTQSNIQLSSTIPVFSPTPSPVVSPLKAGIQPFQTPPPLINPGTPPHIVLARSKRRVSTDNTPKTPSKPVRSSRRRLYD